MTSSQRPQTNSCNIYDGTFYKCHRQRLKLEESERNTRASHCILKEIGKCPLTYSGKTFLVAHGKLHFFSPNSIIPKPAEELSYSSSRNAKPRHTLDIVNSLPV